MRISKVKLSEIGLLLVFKAILEVAYILFVNAHYRYMGFSLQLNAAKLLESYLFLILLFFFLPAGEHKPSALGIKLLSILMVVPTLSLYALKNESRPFLYLFLAGFWLTIFTVRILPRIRVGKIKNSVSVLFLGLVMVSVLVYGGLIVIMGVPTLNLDLTLVYEIRTAYVQALPRIMGYLIPWQANVINSFLIGLAWYKRRYSGLLVTLGLQGLLFLTTGHKSFLLAPALVLFLVYAIQKHHLFRLSLKGVIASTILSFVFHALGGSIMLPSLFIRRLFFVPAQNYFYYYDFFSKHQLMYLSHSFFNPFLENPYNMPVTHMIAKIYYNNPAGSPNTGYLADAYMNFGPAGVLFFSLILGVFFRVLDSITKDTDMALVVAATAIPLVSLVNSALFTTLLTHGFLLSALLLWLHPRGTTRGVGVRSCTK